MEVLKQKRKNEIEQAYVQAKSRNKRERETELAQLEREITDVEMYDRALKAVEAVIPDAGIYLPATDAATDQKLRRFFKYETAGRGGVISARK